MRNSFFLKRAFWKTSKVPPPKPPILDFTKYIPGNMSSPHPDSLLISFSLSPEKTIAAEFSPNESVSSFSSKIKRLLNSEEVKVYSVDSIEFAGQTLLEHIEFEEMFIQSKGPDMLIKIGKSFAKLKIPKWENSKLIADRKNLEALHLPFLYEKTILGFLSALNFREGVTSTNDFIYEVLNKLPSGRANISLPLSDIESENARLSQQLEELRKIRQEALERGQQFARRLLALGFLVFGGQIALVVYGVYVYYNWDIMEPIMYFLQYAGALVLGSLFFVMRGRYEHQNFARWLAKRYQAKRLRKLGFDNERYEELTRKLMENRDEKIRHILNDF